MMNHKQWPRLLGSLLSVLLLSSSYPSPVQAQDIPVQTQNAAQRIPAGKATQVFFQGHTRGNTDFMFSQGDGRNVHVKVDKTAAGNLVTASVDGAPDFVGTAQEKELEEVYVGDLDDNQAADLILTTRSAGNNLGVLVVSLRNNQWETILDKRNMPGGQLRLYHNRLASVTPWQGNRELYQFFPYNPATGTYWEHGAVSVTAATTGADVHMAADAGINSAEEAAFHMTAFGEGTITDYDAPNQPFTSADPHGYEYGYTTENYDGAILSFGINQWQWWSDTIRPLLRQMENTDPATFWDAFSSLDTTSFRTDVMSTGASWQTAYNWAVSMLVPFNGSIGGWNGNCTTGVSRPSTAANCRYVGGQLPTAWRDAFSQLGEVPAFQALEQQAASDDYLQAVRTRYYDTLNADTPGHTWSLRAYALMEDISNNYGINDLSNTPCSLDDWVNDASYDCARYNEAGSRWYQSDLTDQQNVQNLLVWQVGGDGNGGGRPWRFQYIADGHNSSYSINWDSYLAGFGIDMNAPAVFSGQPPYGGTAAGTVRSTTGFETAPDRATMSAGMYQTPYSTSPVVPLTGDTTSTESTVAPATTPGGTEQLQALFTYSDGSTTDVTNSATWSSNNTAVAQVDATGLVTAYAPGVATITATYQGSNTTYTHSSTIDVPGTEVTPSAVTLATGGHQQLTATSYDNYGNSTDVTNAATWTSNNTAVATVSSTGYVTAVSPGNATVSFTYNGSTSGSGITVYAPTMTGLSLSPTSASIVAGNGRQLTATASYNNGTTADVTNSATWTSSNTAVATVSSTGYVTANAAGTATITASYGGYSASATITVSAPVVTGLSVSPSSASVPAGNTRQLTATATYNNGTTSTVTSSATWSSSNTAVATVSSTGLVTTKAAGSVTITASYGGYSASSAVTVSAPVVTGLSVSPTSASVAAGNGQQLTATATYSDGTTSTVTSSATWSSSNTTVATVSTSGYVTAQATGTATITASYGGYSASSTITVTAPTVTGLSVSPTSATVTTGASQQLTATATYSNSTTGNVSSSATWSSSNTAVATVSSTGNVTTVAAGTVTITASYSGYSASSTITVNAPTVTGLSVSPSSASLGIGGGQQLTATASYNNGTTSNVSGSASWSTSNTQVATVSAAGYVTAQGTGTATITASYGGYSSSASISVSCTTGSSFNCPYTLSGSTTSSVSTGVYVWYKYLTSAGSTYTVNLTANSGDPDLAVFDLNQSQVGASSAGGSDSVTFTASYSGYYYIRVYGYSAANYTLSVSSGGGGGCTAGSSFDCPITLSGSTSGSASSGQYVYYRYYASSGTTYTVNLTANSGDPDLAIFDPNRSQIASSSAGGSDSASFTANTTGYYFIRVYGYSAASYSLSVSTGGGGGTPPPCSSGSSFSCPITFSGSTSGSVSTGQNLYYQFYAYANTTYTVRLTANSGDPDLTVYNPSQAQIGASSAVGSDTVTFTATTSGYYYARVYGYSASSFSLSASGASY